MESHTNFEVQKCELCAPANGVIAIYYLNMTKINGINYVNYDVKYGIPLDERVGVRYYLSEF